MKNYKSLSAKRIVTAQRKLARLNLMGTIEMTECLDDKIKTTQLKLLSLVEAHKLLPEDSKHILPTFKEKRLSKIAYGISRLKFECDKSRIIDFEYPSQITSFDMSQIMASVSEVMSSAIKIYDDKIDDVGCSKPEMLRINKSNYWIEFYSAPVIYLRLGGTRDFYMHFPNKITVLELEQFEVELKAHHDSALNSPVQRTDSITPAATLMREINEMVHAVANYHNHVVKETSFGYVIRADKRRLNITHDGLVGGYFSVESFKGFDDYEFWINKVKTNSYGTVIADNIAFHLSKTKDEAGKFR